MFRNIENLEDFRFPMSPGSQRFVPGIFPIFLGSQRILGLRSALNKPHNINIPDIIWTVWHSAQPDGSQNDPKIVAKVDMFCGESVFLKK